MRKYRSLIIVLILLYSFRADAQSVSDVAGKWRGEFIIRDNIKAPFNFEIDAQGNVTLINGAERFDAGRLQRRKDSVFVPLDQFDNVLALRYQNNRMKGVLRKQDGTQVIAPVSAAKGRSERFVNTTPAARDISGRYSVTFTFSSGKKEESVAVFEQQGNRLTGTFLKPSGDARFLEGIVAGNKFYLSSFIGSSPGYYEGAVDENGRITGFQAGTKVRYPFSGRKNDSAQLEDAFDGTKNQKGNVIRFSLPDIAGNTVSLTDPKYKDKVVIIAVTGTWCPNCIDEAAFLSPWYKENKNRGVEIVTVHFERQADTAYSRKVMSRFRKRFDITYDQVFGGLPDGATVMKSLEGLENFKSFPTTIFLDKQGRISRVHSGYSGPATGKFYTDFVNEFNAEVDRLLAE